MKPAKTQRIEYSKSFDKEFDKAPVNIQRAFLKRRSLFEIDPFHPQLRNHALSGTLKGLRSIDITGDWRALYTELHTKENKIITFKALGTHSQLYH